MGSGQHQTASDEIDHVPEEARLPVLSLVTSRIQMQHRENESAIRLSQATLAWCKAGVTGERFYLRTSHRALASGSTGVVPAFAMDLRDSTTSGQLRLIAEGMVLLIEASHEGSVDPLAEHLASMAQQQGESIRTSTGSQC